MVGNDSLQDSQNTEDNPWKAAHKMSERVEQQQMDCWLEVVDRVPVEEQVRPAVEPRKAGEQVVVQMVLVEEQGEERMVVVVGQGEVGMAVGEEREEVAMVAVEEQGEVGMVAVEEQGVVAMVAVEEQGEVGMVAVVLELEL